MDFVSTDSGFPITSSGRIKQDLCGVGPLVGVEGNFGMQYGFSIYGNVSVALLYGHSHIHSNSSETFITGTNIDNLRNRRDAYQTSWTQVLAFASKPVFAIQH